MATHVRHPLLIAETPRVAGARTFALLYALESLARASLVTVLPLTAYGLFQSKEAVSLVYTCVSLVTLGFSFAIPGVVRRLSRRWAYSLGCALLGLFALLLALGAPAALVAAMLCRTAGQALLNVTLNLYIMDHIGRRELTRSEPLRLATATLAWGVAPYVGVRLMQGFGLWAPAALSLAATLTLAAVFWTLRLSDRGALRPGPAMAASHPIAAIRRFAAQPRLRLAWTIAFARSCFWMTFIVYVPILAIEGGLDAATAGLAVAAGNLTLLNNLAARRLAERHSLRRVLAAAFAACAGLVAIAGLLGPASPVPATVAMVGAAFFAALVDGLGPVPFLRAVRIHERPAMTSVYRTYLDASELLPPLAYFFLFQIGGFAAAFGALATLLATTGWLTARHLPRSM